MKKKIIFALHGFLGLPSDWQWLEIPGYEVVPVDYMNIRGLTPDVKLEKWGENFNLWIQKNYPQSQKFLIGYSLGGRLALHAVEASSAKPFWQGLILISTNPGLVTENEKNQRKDSDLRWAQRFQTMDFSRVVKEWNQQAVFANSKVEPVRKLEDYQSEVLAKSMVQWSLGLQKDFRKSEDIFAVQNLWIVGELDIKYVNLVQELEQSEKPLQTAVVEGASHRVMFDQPEKVRQYIQSFLKNL